MAHRGQVRPNLCGLHADTTAPATTAEVPMARGLSARLNNTNPRYQARFDGASGPLAAIA